MRLTEPASARADSVTTLMGAVWLMSPPARVQFEPAALSTGDGRVDVDARGGIERQARVTGPSHGVDHVDEAGARARRVVGGDDHHAAGQHFLQDGDVSAANRSRRRLATNVWAEVLSLPTMPAAAPAAGQVVRDEDVGRVHQQRAGAAVRRARIDAAPHVERVARCLRRSRRHPTAQPPRALMLPYTCVVSSDQAITLPPLPDTRASALMVASLET